jgi:hypothetical protein
MRLTRNQLAEVDNYLNELTRYRETYQELKDHVLTALQDLNACTFDIQFVKDIVEEDFGGRENIIKYEAVYKRSSTKRYFKLLAAEMLNTFKWVGLIKNLCLFIWCAMLFSSQKLSTEFGSFPIAKVMYIVFYLPGVYFIFLKFVADRHKKASMLNIFLFKVWLLSATSGILIIQGISFFSKYFHDSNKLQFGLFLIMYVIFSIYVRAYLNLYKNKIRVLAV